MIDSEDDSGDIDDEFVEKFESDRSDDGYGMLLDKGTQEQREMSDEFNGVEVGGPIADPDVQATALAPMAEPEGGGIDVEPSVADDASVVVGGPIPVQEVVATPLPAAPSDKKAAHDMDGMKFGEVFKHFRGKGDKSFQWRGKTYTTALKAEGTRGARSMQPQAKAASDQKTADAAVAAEVFQQPDAAPKPRPPPKESTNGIGPKLTGMLPKPGARGIYEGAVIGPNTRNEVAAAIDRSRSAKVAPLTVTGKDGTDRPAQSLADLIAARKANGV